MSIAKKTTEQFINEIEERHPGKYNILGEYIGHDKPIETLYNECGHIGYPLAHSLWKGCNCGKCHGPANKSHDEFVEMIEDMYPGKYTILGQYTKSSKPIKIRYNSCGHIAEPKAAYIRRGAGCPICNRGTKVTQEEFEKRFFDMTDGTYQPLEEYKSSKQKMDILHKTCGTIFKRNIGNVFKIGCRCPNCYPSSSVLLVPGFNDIHTTNPEMEELLKYPEDAFNHTQHTKDKLWFICPHCGNELLKRVSNVTTNGLKCPRCNINYSYGERFMANLLNELKIDNIYQFTPDWIKPYSYDFQFNIEKKKYIVEVDGGWHFEENEKSDLSLEEVIERDKYKQQVAEDHGYIVIRIDYNYKSLDKRNEYLINSINESDLNDLLKLNSYDYTSVIKRSSTPLVKTVADLWNSYDEKASQKIQLELHLRDHIVLRLLYLASELKMIKESKSEIKRLNRKYGNKIYGRSNSKKVMCNETGEIFNTYKEANKKYHASIYNYFHNDNVHFSGTLPDGTRLTWTKIEDEKVA